jgi:hypothetical protein
MDGNLVTEIKGTQPFHIINWENKLRKAVGVVGTMASTDTVLLILGKVLWGKENNRK